MHATKAYKGRRGIDPLILHLNTRKVMSGRSASSPSHFTQRAKTVIPVEEEAGWAPGLVYMFRRRHESLAPAKNQTPNCPPCSHATILTMLSQLPRMETV